LKSLGQSYVNFTSFTFVENEIKIVSTLLDSNFKAADFCPHSIESTAVLQYGCDPADWQQ